MPVTLPRTPDPSQGLDAPQCQLSACKKTHLSQSTPSFIVKGGGADLALGRVRADLFCTHVFTSAHVSALFGAHPDALASQAAGRDLSPGLSTGRRFSGAGYCRGERWLAR